MTQRFYVYEVRITERSSGAVDSTLYDTQTSADIAVESYLRMRKNRGYVTWLEGIDIYELSGPNKIEETVRLIKVPVFSREMPKPIL